MLKILWLVNLVVISASLAVQPRVHYPTKPGCETPKREGVDSHRFLDRCGHKK